MKSWWSEFKYDIVPYTVLISLLVFLIWMFSLAGYDMRVQTNCARNGYPSNITTWNYKAYCIRIVEQTEYVVPLEDVLSQEK